MLLKEYFGQTEEELLMSIYCDVLYQYALHLTQDKARSRDRASSNATAFDFLIMMPLFLSNVSLQETGKDTKHEVILSQGSVKYKFIDAYVKMPDKLPEWKGYSRRAVVILPEGGKHGVRFLLFDMQIGILFLIIPLESDSTQTD